MDWATPEDLEGQVRRLWNAGRMLIAPSDGGSTFPLSLRLRRPESSAMSHRFDDVRRWIRALEEGSKSRRGFGYEIEWTEIEHRQLGRNRVPAAVVVATREDALRLIGKQQQADGFDRLAATTLQALPALRTWISKKPMVVLEHHDDWEKIVSVLIWFCAHPRPGVYLRQLDIPGVDTKFIETRKGLLSELLDIVLPPNAVDASVGRNFESRYGLLSKPPLIRFRILDPRCRIVDLSDLAIPASQFAELYLDVRRVFITENEINGLAFPEVPNAVVIFGLGYGLDRLAEARWLNDREIFYWGDIDTHGFAILDRLRASFPSTSSLLMDHDTLMQHRSLWVQEDGRCAGPLARLTEDERRLFELLVADRLGVAVRLEQERIAFAWVRRALEAIAGSLYTLG